MIVFACCGSFCTLARGLCEMEKLAASGETLVPIFSEIVRTTDTRFGAADAFRLRAESICKTPLLTTIAEAEPIGPRLSPELMVIAPCSGNTLAKIAHGITDSVVTMAAKAHLRNERPLVIALATNDGLSAALENIGRLLCRKHIYFVPFGQDDPTAKPRSLIAHFPLLCDTIAAAREGRQLQPILQ